MLAKADRFADSRAVEFFDEIQAGRQGRAKVGLASAIQAAQRALEFGALQHAIDREPAHEVGGSLVVAKLAERFFGDLHAEDFVKSTDWFAERFADGGVGQVECFADKVNCSRVFSRSLSVYRLRATLCGDLLQVVRHSA